MAQIVELLLEPLAPGQLADGELAAGQAHRLRGHDLVGQRVLDHAVLVDPRLVGKRVRAHHGLVRLDRESRQVAHQPAGGGDVLRLDTAQQLRELGGAGPQGHDHLLEGGVAGAFAKPVDRDLHLARAGLDGGKGVRGRQPQVVVAVDRDRGAGSDQLDDATDKRGELGWDRIPDRVGDVDRGGAGAHHRLVDGEQEGRVGAGGVLGRELDLRVATQLLPSVADPADRLGERLVARHPQLVLEVDVRGRDEDVEVRTLRDPDRLHRLLRIAVAAAGERGDRDAPDLLRDPVDRLPVARRGGGEAGLDDVHVEADQLAGDLQLLGGGEPRAGRLLPIAKRRIEDPDRARGHERAGRYRDGHQ